MKVIHYGFRENSYQVIKTVHLDRPKSLFNNPESLEREIKKGTHFSYLEDVDGNSISKEEALKAIKKTTNLTDQG